MKTKCAKYGISGILRYSLKFVQCFVVLAVICVISFVPNLLSKAGTSVLFATVIRILVLSSSCAFCIKSDLTSIAQYFRNRTL